MDFIYNFMLFIKSDNAYGVEFVILQTVKLWIVGKLVLKLGPNKIRIRVKKHKTY